MQHPVDSPGREQALAAMWSLPSVQLGHYPTPVEEMARLRAALGGGPRLLVKRDDAITFGFGGNKVRKVELVAAQALAEGADTLITTGGVQSNHCRVTAAAAARLGLHCVLVLNGARPDVPRANTLLDTLFGADLRYVERREDRAPAMAAIAAELRAEGRRPVEVPLGASTPLGAMGLARAVGELVDHPSASTGAGIVPNVIIHSTSSGGTQAGLIAGCILHGLPTRIVGVSADTPAGEMQRIVAEILRGMAERLGLDREALVKAREIEVDDTFVGDGYGIPTDASREAAALVARTEALVVDDTYTAKALAGLCAYVRDKLLDRASTVMFWHTGGQVGIFA